MPYRQHEPLRAVHFFEDDMSPRQRGKIDFGRGLSLDDCPYDEPDNVTAWQAGWQKARDRVLAHRLKDAA